MSEKAWKISDISEIHFSIQLKMPEFISEVL